MVGSIDSYDSSGTCDDGTYDDLVCRRRSGGIYRSTLRRFAFGIAGIVSGRFVPVAVRISSAGDALCQFPDSQDEC